MTPRTNRRRFTPQLIKQVQKFIREFTKNMPLATHEDIAFGLQDANIPHSSIGTEWDRVKVASFVKVHPVYKSRGMHVKKGSTPKTATVRILKPTNPSISRIDATRTSFSRDVIDVAEIVLASRLQHEDKERVLKTLFAK